MVLVIIQARMGSKRLPGKVMKKIKDKPLLYYVINQIRGSKLNPNIVVATTNLKDDDVIADFVKAQNVDIFRGKENDVLDRFYQCAKQFSNEPIVRISADSPFLDYNLVDECVKKFKNSKCDYVSNIIKKEQNCWKEDPNGYPLGTAVEVFSFKTLEKAWMQSKDPYEREHVTGYIIKHPEIFKLDYIINSRDLSKYRIVVDYQKDFELAEKIINQMPNGNRFEMNQIISFLQNIKD
jgi:spore coat polysaccharide biosynthesis protein SpsF